MGKTKTRVETETLVAERSTTRPKADIRQANLHEILKAAEQVFADNGFNGTTMAEIARVSAIPKPNIYYYFGNKEKLYQTLLRDVDTRWRQELDDWILPERTPADALTGYVRAKMAHSRDRPHASKVFANELLHGAPYLKRYLRVTLRKHVERKAEVVRGWIAKGLMDPVDPQHLFFNIWAMTQTYADFETQICAVLGVASIDAETFETATETVIQLVMSGCGARAGGRPLPVAAPVEALRSTLPSAAGPARPRRRGKLGALPLSKDGHMGADFSDQVVIVTGAGSGIGRAAAEDFGRAGASVVCLDVVAAEETAAAITTNGGTATARCMDVRDAAAWEQLVAEITASWGTIDILVNNAGIAIAGDTAIGMNEEGWDRIMDVNAKGVWLGMKHVLPVMLEQGRGKICNVASTASHIGLRDAAAYCASKGAVLALTRQVGVQYAPHNIQINSVSPGTTMTGLQRDVTEAQRAAFLPLTPIGRFAEPKEVSDVILFLCSSSSSFMAGADVSVDGGMVAV